MVYYRGMTMERLNYDEDNFSGRQGRGTLYDILSNGDVVYHDIDEEAVDKLCEEMEHKQWLYGEIEVREIKK